MSASASRFRFRLFLVMTLAGAAVTVAAIFSVRHSMEADLRRNLDRRFESQFDALLAVQEAHNAAIMDHCRTLVRSPRIHGAIEDDGLDLLYSIAEGELRTVLPAQKPASREGAEPGPGRSLLRVAAYRFLDHTGAVIPPPAGKGAEDAGAWESQIAMEGLPAREHIGYILAKVGSEPEAIHEVTATPIVSTQTGELIGALVLVFKPIEMPARLAENGIITGFWSQGRLELHPHPAGEIEPVARAVTAALQQGREGGMNVEVGGARHVAYFKTLNAGSSFQPGALVSLYPLAEYLAQQQSTRWQIIGISALLLVAGLGASHFLAGKLAVPVEKLEIVSTENVVQRERVEAALDVTNEELRARNEELKNAMAELKATQKQVIQQERLRALGEMASGIAHDFNNALVPILGFTELLKLGPAVLADREKASAYIDMIHTSAKDAASVVARLRQFYRKHEEGDVFEPVDLGKLVKQTVTLTQPRWKNQAQANGATIRIQTELESVPPVLGEEAALREVLTNLIFNAVDAMPSGGAITIRTRADGACAVLEVEDSGTGMSEEVRQRCLDPFFSTKGERGTGLGLSMVFGIVQRHGGRIDIRSVEGSGSAFVITLPLDQSLPDKPKAAEEAPAQKPLRVLVVDDEPQVRDLLSAALVNDGHRVQMAENGAAGLRCFRDGAFDVVLTDKAMPVMSGDQMACAIRQLAPHVPIILLTGFGQFLDKADMPAVSVLLSKPVGIRTLREALVTALKAA